MVIMGGSNYLVKIFKTILVLLLFFISHKYDYFYLLSILCSILILIIIWIPDSSYKKLFYRLFHK